MKQLVLTTALVVAAGAAFAKLPALSDEAKAKAAEAAAKTAHGNKVADFKLCKEMDRVAAAYVASAKKAGKTVTPTATPPCADPGAFVYAPPAAPGAPAAAPAPATAAAAAPAPKK
jgi:hypothetical protein